MGDVIRVVTRGVTMNNILSLQVLYGSICSNPRLTTAQKGKVFQNTFMHSYNVMSYTKIIFNKELKECTELRHLLKAINSFFLDKTAGMVVIMCEYEIC